MIRGLGRKNRKTRGGREGGGERGEGRGGRWVREPRGRLIYSGYSGGGAQRMLGVWRATTPCVASCDTRMPRARARANTPLRLCVPTVCTRGHWRCSPLRTLTTVIVRNFSPSSTINNPICAPDFRWKVGNFWRKIFFNFSRETNVCRIIIVNYYY